MYAVQIDCTIFQCTTQESRSLYDDACGPSSARTLLSAASASDISPPNVHPREKCGRMKGIELAARSRTTQPRRESDGGRRMPDRAERNIDEAAIGNTLTLASYPSYSDPRASIDASWQRDKTVDLIPSHSQISSHSSSHSSCHCSCRRCVSASFMAGWYQPMWQAWRDEGVGCSTPIASGSRQCQSASGQIAPRHPQHDGERWLRRRARDAWTNSSKSSALDSPETSLAYSAVQQPVLERGRCANSTASSFSEAKPKLRSPSRQRRKYSIYAVCETDELPSAQGSSGKVKPTCNASPSSQQPSRSRQDKKNLDYVVRSGIAGGVAGCVAKTVIAPLDRVKILFQASNPEFAKYSGHWLGVYRAGKDIVSDQGVWALFKGHSATLMRIFPYAAIKYMAYDRLHFWLMPTRQSETSARLFVAGASSGVLSVFLTYPLELIRVRLAFETKGSSAKARGTDGLAASKGSLGRIIRQIYTEGSTEAPFSGDARRRALRQPNQAAPARNFVTTAASAISQSQGVLSSRPSSASPPQPPPPPPPPPQVAQAQAIAAGASFSTPVPPSAPTPTLQTANTLLHRYPLMKFYRGFSVTVLGMIPYAGTSFLVFGRCKRALQNFFAVEDGAPGKPGGVQGRSGWQPSKTTIDLTSGAIAGAISQTAAYPFEVIRRRQQVAALVRPTGMVGILETTTWIWRTGGGWRGFYTGLSIGFLKVVPMTSVSFAVWMGMKRYMGI